MSKKTYTGLNIQWPISELILSGEKIIETRTYPLPERLKGIELAFIETPGKKGKFKSRVVAIIKFSDSFEYKTKKEFYADIEKHKVAKNSDWAWKDKSKHGWIIESLEVLEEPVPLKKRPGIIYTKEISV